MQQASAPRRWPDRRDACGIIDAPGARPYAVQRPYAIAPDTVTRRPQRTARRRRGRRRRERCRCAAAALAKGAQQGSHSTRAKPCARAASIVLCGGDATYSAEATGSARVRAARRTVRGSVAGGRPMRSTARPQDSEVRSRATNAPDRAVVAAAARHRRQHVQLAQLRAQEPRRALAAE